MNIRLAVLGREILSFTTDSSNTDSDREADWHRWKAMNGTDTGDFGFNHRNLTALEEPTTRWETA